MNECDIEYPPCECDEPTESSLPVGIEMRPMEPRDLDEVKRLHEQCFPVRYDMAFYENVVRGFITRGQGNAKEPLYTQVAVVPTPPGGLDDGRRAGGYGGYGDSNIWSTAKANVDHRGSPEGVPMSVDEDGPETGGGEEEEQQQQQPRRYSPSGAQADGAGAPGAAATGGSAGCSGGAVGAGRVEAAGEGSTWAPSAGADGSGADVGGSARKKGAGGAGRETGQTGKSIVGLITCQVMPADRCRDQDRLGLGREGSAHSEVVYILTLGTEMRYRRQGIGRALLRRCVWLSRQEPSIGAVYLHVITTNPPAHRFYESEGFVQVCEISDYYRINGELYDCFLYALFVNGAQPPGEWGWGIQSLSRRLRSIISFFRRTLGQVPEEGKLTAAVVAAACSSTSSQESKEARLQQQQGDPEEMELDEERPPPPPCDASGRTSSPDQGRAPKPFAAAVDARSSRGSREQPTGVGNNATAITGCSGAASASAPKRYPGRGFACSVQATQQPCSSTVVQAGLLHGGISGDDHDHHHPRNEDVRGNLNLVAAVPSRGGGGGVAPPTVTLWDASTSGVGAWG
eukprot:g11285.t1